MRVPQETKDSGNSYLSHVRNKSLMCLPLRKARGPASCYQMSSETQIIDFLSLHYQLSHTHMSGMNAEVLLALERSWLLDGIERIMEW